MARFWCIILCLFSFQTATRFSEVRGQHVEGSCADEGGSEWKEDGSDSTISLHNGVQMPVFQLGTAHMVTDFGPDPDAPAGFIGLQPERVYQQIELALRMGIRAFDSALNYGSHQGIAHVLGEWWRTVRLQARKDVWITTKIFHPFCGVCLKQRHMPTLSDMAVEEAASKTEEHFERSLMELNVGYLDMMLLHWPGEDEASAGRPLDPQLARQKRLAAWKVLEDMYQRGWTRAIGVSNFSVKHLQQLQEDGATIVPMVNQIEASVEVQHVDIRKYCHQQNITLQAFSTLRGLNGPAKDILTEMGQKYGKDLAQVAFRYLYQHGYTIVFLSTSAGRMISNTEIFDFELTSEEMQAIDGLNSDEGGWGLPKPNEIP